jgi:hypothetical protein
LCKTRTTSANFQPLAVTLNKYRTHYMLKNKVIIKSFIPNKQTELSNSINEIHKNILVKSYGFAWASNNKFWFQEKKNVICFYAIDEDTDEILCAYRHEFIFSSNEVLKTPFISGIDIEKYNSIYERLTDIANEGIYSETCAFWCNKDMKYKKSLLSKLLFVYGIVCAFLNNSKNIVGLAPDELVNYYTKFGLCLDYKIKNSVEYSENKYPCYFVLFNKQLENKYLFEIVRNSIDNNSEFKLEPYENVYLKFEKPLIIF